MARVTIQQKLSVNQELITSARLIKAGLGQVQSLHGGNDFYHLPLLTLASGFERLMKVTLSFRFLETEGRFPGIKEIPVGRNGHDLTFLLELVKKKCFLPGYVGHIPVAKEDWDYLESDRFLSFLEALTRFGKSARYYHVDVVLGKDPDSLPPEREWEAIETSIFLSRDDLVQEMDENPASRNIYRELNSEMVVIGERFARSLARLYTIGRIGSEAKAHMAHLSPFWGLKDSELGRSSYDPFGRV
ncbi:hypothetical protein LV476_05000 [Guyparkeria hydrothermalis]|uniref:hypothetical protein n=1 Tax=Guyparkeria hydrothermalis TaxID=923 RepID=UPI0020209D82|nr:hypothetical protein [Guyparkeria hydrothermalis]MCL7744309.1 hypothetical protein [Guyparkeria hydrothermalis]